MRTPILSALALSAALFSAPALAAETAGSNAELEQSCIKLYERRVHFTTGRACYPQGSASAKYYSDLYIMLVAADPEIAQRCVQHDAELGKKHQAATLYEWVEADFEKRYPMPDAKTSAAKLQQYCRDTQPMREEAIAHAEAAVARLLPAIISENAKRQRQAGETVSEDEVRRRQQKALQQWERERDAARAEKQDWNQPAAKRKR